MRARLLALGRAILARLGFLRRRVPAAPLSLPAPVLSPCPAAPRIARCASLLGVPGCNREGGAP